MRCASGWLHGKHRVLQMSSSCLCCDDHKTCHHAVAQVGRLMSFAASLLALSAMTVVSVAIGRSFRHVPAFLQSSLPIGEWAGAAMMVYFGVRTLRVRAVP